MQGERGGYRVGRLREIAGNPFTFGMPKVAFATYDKLPNLADDEHALVAALRALEVESEPAVWTDDAVAWAARGLPVL